MAPAKQVESATTVKKLEERVAALEKQVAELLTNGTAPREKDWRRTIGMFTGDEGMKEIDAAGQAIRERERRQARARNGKKRKIAR